LLLKVSVLIVKVADRAGADVNRASGSPPTPQRARHR